MTPRVRRHLRRLFDESKPVYAQRTVKLDKTYERGDLIPWKEEGVPLEVVQRLFRVRMISHHPFGDGTREAREANIRAERKRIEAEENPETAPAAPVTPPKAAGKSRK